MLQYTAGNIKNYLQYWFTLTKNPWILKIIQYGLKLDFIDIPCQNKYNQNTLSIEELDIIDLEIEKLLTKKVVTYSKHEPGEFISGLFTRPKKDGSKRMILNLKRLNLHIEYNKFKMESIQNVLQCIEKNCYMASVDLKDAFFSVPIYSEHQKYLKFTHRDQLYKFISMPNGYGPAMRVFTKLLKVPFSYLRSLKHISVVYVDDTYLQGETLKDCIHNVQDTVKVLRKLGFTIHIDKSIFEPKQEITFLGFVFNSVNMTITLTKEKKQKIYVMSNEILDSNSQTIRKIASFIGNLTASLPAVPFGKLHYRSLERDKISALKISKGDFDAKMTLSNSAIEDTKWWINNIIESSNNIATPPVEITLFTDASNLGWGITDGTNPSGGLWNEFESAQHINWKELKAIHIGILTYCKTNNFKHARVMCDNTTAISYINNMGGIQSTVCDSLSKDIWMYCHTIDLWITAAFIPGKENKVDDKSRRINSGTEWMLNRKLFKKIINQLYSPEVDLFASRINKQLDKYVSWHPDPYAFAVDAFSIKWDNYTYFIFPPFSIINKVISKMKEDETTGLLIVPDWPSQSWYPRAMSLGAVKMKISPRDSNLLSPQDKNISHPLAGQMYLLVIQTK